MTKTRRHFKQVLSLKDRLIAWAQGVRETADQLAPGPDRETMLQKARRAEASAHFEDWVNSPGLRPPT
jgi:hypothetical protein